MALRTTVKVSHVSNLSDARYCAGMGVDWLGFRVVPGDEHYISPEVFQDIRGWIAGPGIVAELYGLDDMHLIGEIVKTYAPDLFELTLQEFQRFGHLLELPSILRVSIGELKTPFEGHGKVSYLLSDESVTCQDIAGRGYPVIKTITSAESLEESLRDGCFAGIELEAPKELRPGVTNYDHLGEILEALEEE